MDTTRSMLYLPLLLFCIEASQYSGVQKQMHSTAGSFRSPTSRPQWLQTPTTGWPSPHVQGAPGHTELGRYLKPLSYSWRLLLLKSGVGSPAKRIKKHVRIFFWIPECYRQLQQINFAWLEQKPQKTFVYALTYSVKHYRLDLTSFFEAGHGNTLWSLKTARQMKNL